MPGELGVFCQTCQIHNNEPQGSKKKNAAGLPAAARYDHRKEKSVSEQEGALHGLVAPIGAVAIISRTVNKGSALQNIYFFLKAVLLSIHVH